MKIQNYIQNIIASLCQIGERQLEGEDRACRYIKEFLTAQVIQFSEDEYHTFVPKFKKWSLKVDGKIIPSLPSGLVSGKIQSNYAMLSSLISSQKNLYDANINFNPTSDTISRSNHYFAPALSVSRDDIEKIAKAKKVRGRLKVEKTDHVSANLLVGNRQNPKAIIFSHYDSIQTGAVDNASGVALSLQMALELPELLADNLFAICGNEELSYDQPIYWGHGYREFEKKHSQILKSTSQILILDSFGQSKPEVISDINIVKLGFPIASLQYTIGKVKMISGSLASLMPIYHTAEDIPKKIKPYFMKQAKDLALKLLKK